MKRALRIVGSLAAILIILVCMAVIAMLIHYAIYGNPIKDTEHIIKDIENLR